MDYIAFKSLHRILRQGIQKYIINEKEINDNSNGLDFCIRNGRIATEIHLACALCYFTGHSYLDIMVSHGIGKTDLYHSVWADVHATNVCTMLQFNFPATISECKSISNNFYHLKVRINIECAFSILTNQWCLLKTLLSTKISISRINALISCLCKLHNFCINNGNSSHPERDSHDLLMLMDFMDSNNSKSP